MLGEVQQETLRRYAKMLENQGDEPAKLIIKIHPWARFTREAGGGSGFPISIAYVYESDQYEDLPKWIATCRHDYTALEKGKEIGRYLCDKLGCSRDLVKLRKK